MASAHYWILTISFAIAASPAVAREDRLDLRGTWVMDSAYEIKGDGTRTTNYGQHPNGLLMIDAEGRYTLQIFRVDRTRFALDDKGRGTAEEYRDAAMGSSTHFGTVAVDAARHLMTFDVKGASFPNWEGKRQIREYQYLDGLLTYAVPASASGNGTVAYSLWRRLSTRQ